MFLYFFSIICTFRMYMYMYISSYDPFFKYRVLLKYLQHVPLYLTWYDAGWLAITVYYFVFCLLHVPLHITIRSAYCIGNLRRLESPRHFADNNLQVDLQLKSLKHSTDNLITFIHVNMLIDVWWICMLTLIRLFILIDIYIYWHDFQPQK